MTAKRFAFGAAADAVRAVALLVLLLFGTCHASAADGPLADGIWEGRVGTQDVTICLSNGNPSFYYYDKYATPLKLVADDHPAGGAVVLKEFPPLVSAETASDASGTWTLTPVGRTALRGTWSDTRGARQVPIEARAVSRAACDSPEFAGRIHFPVSIVETDATTGIKYRALGYADAGDLAADRPDLRFQLLGTDRVTAGINADLRSTAPDGTNDCPQDGGADVISPGTSDLEPTFVAAHWVYASWEVDPGSCGEASIPEHGRRLWNRVTGAKIDDLRPWFTADGLTSRGPQGAEWIGFGKRLADVVAHAAEAADAKLGDPSEVVDGCVTPGNMAGEVDVDLDVDGFEFWLGVNAMGACMVPVPDADVVPLLTPQARKILASIRADLRRPAAPSSP